MTDDPIVHKVKKKTATNSYYINPYEALSNFGEEAKNQAGKVISEVAFEIFSRPKREGTLEPGQEIDLTKHDNKSKQPDIKSLEKKSNYIRPAIEHIDYIGEILKAGELKPEDKQKTQREIQELIVELKSLASATKQLEKEIIEATGHTVVNPGEYHKTFFKWLLSFVKDARVKIDNAGIWLSAMSGKQRKKGFYAGKKKQTNYWDMAQKHGTKFTLSGERGIATQAG